MMSEIFIILSVAYVIFWALSVLCGFIIGRARRRAAEHGKSCAEEAWRFFERGFQMMDDGVKGDPEDCIDWFEDSPTHGCLRHKAREGVSGSEYQRIACSEFDGVWRDRRRAFLAQFPAVRKSAAVEPEQQAAPAPRRLVRR